MTDVIKLCRKHWYALRKAVPESPTKEPMFHELGLFGGIGVTITVVDDEQQCFCCNYDPTDPDLPMTLRRPRSLEPAQ